ncbi:two-component regulator propeller domain-containing protein [Kordia sp.]|uniref:ligand-binding sensor domain-containing protein n=1 Tax=Kordia sp. TaxID=1965332 RepID=UPI0025BB8253|nr:two-component regulator propeller domain-containing protein [Kordia sp.]MCH2194312.1 LytTR family transcriptional regulator DNA-binding domain-containing protein [Kordia sp.]
MVLLLIFYCFLSKAQSYVYQNFSIDDGLPSSEVYDVYQDKLGYVWFATDKGLSRYNGYEFKNYTVEDGLPGNTILKFYPQKNGQVWCYDFHSQKLFYFNEIFDGFYSYEHNDILKKQLYKSSIIKSVRITEGKLHIGGYRVNGLIVIDKNGNLNSKYVGTDVKPIKTFGIEKGTFFSTQYLLTDTDLHSIKRILPAHNIHGFLVNDHIHVFMANHEVYIQNNQTNYLIKTKKSPIGIKQTKQGSLFVGYRHGGAKLYDFQGNLLNTFLPNKSVSNFLIDHEGGYWFTTINSGVFYVKNIGIKNYTTSKITSLTKNKDNDLFIGFYNGNIARKKHHIIENLYTSKLKFPSTAVEYDMNTDRVYGLSDNKIMDVLTKEVFVALYANNLSFTKHKRAFAFNRSVIFNIHDSTEIPVNIVPSIQDLVWFKDKMLLATSEGLFVKKQDSILKIKSESEKLNVRLDNIAVNEKTNTAYIASQGLGVIVYSDTIFNISKKNGLTSNSINEVYVENDSVVWACTNSGLNKIIFHKDATSSIITLTKDDGLVSNEIEDVEIVSDTIWIGTAKGLCFFPSRIVEQKEVMGVDYISLNSLSVKGKRKDSNNRLRLSYGENDISFRLQAISFKHSEDVVYKYRLKEIDQSWKETKNRTITFPSLEPGRYTFEAKACLFNNCNDKVITKEFIIIPPFWQTSWFYLICVLLCIGLVYIFFKIRVLTYNKDVTRELIRLMIKYLKRNEKNLLVRSNGQDIKIGTHKILYVKSQGNYLDIVTKDQTFTIRCKISDFVNKTPDPLEYLRIHKSYIIRIDQVSAKGRNWVVINEENIGVGKTYLAELKNIKL